MDGFLMESPIGVMDSGEETGQMGAMCGMARGYLPPGKKERETSGYRNVGSPGEVQKKESWWEWGTF